MKRKMMIHCSADAVVAKLEKMEKMKKIKVV